ncbi:SCY1 2 [Brachionus plicatilis]|uniref:SCY1 2 n=1 Tax=Brachionus plicatilis TaxID=10195 RepID=A0A3M7Q5T7_BRAPC|nr:SCY1 2 [Brachionus plicatilis]
MSQKEFKATAQDYLQKAGNVSKEYLNLFKNKLATTVVDTVYMAESITKNVIPGNPVTREYEVTKHVGSAGPGLLWKLYSGFKKSTRQEATVFVLHKKSLEVFSKKDRDLIVEAFRKGATQLARIKHPRILSLQHQLEESKDSLAFATEPCFSSLANALGNHENMPSPLPDDFKDFKLLEVETKYGLLQLAEALSFLHKDAKILHRNICPESIIINSNGAWKLAGFEFFVTNNNDPNDALKFPFKEWDGSVAAVLNPTLEYLAPEYGLSSECDCSSDMFSFGMLFYSVYNNGKTLYSCSNNYSAFVKNVEELKSLTNSQMSSIPSDIREYLKMLMHLNSELRPDAGQVTKIPFFDDVAVKTLEYLDSSFQVDNLQKSMFFKSLPQIIDKLPQRVCLQRIIPCLEQEFINPDMIPFILPSIFLIAEQSSTEEYVKYILPRLKTIFKIQKPIQILLIVLKNMSLILSKTPPTDIKEHILPLVCRSLETDTVEIQELCLATLPTFAHLLDSNSIKHQIIPRIRKLCLESSTLSVRVNSLICIGKILEHLEKWVVLDDVLPILEKITVRDSAVLMAMLGIYKIVLSHPKLGITKDLLATRVIPFLVPICIDNNLNMKQFNAYMTLVKEMMSQVESEQKKKLEQIEALEREKSIIPYSIAGSGSSKPKEVIKSPDTMMDQLMAGYGVTTASQQSANPPPSFHGESLVKSRSGNMPKKELTLSEKQELAARLEREEPKISSSMSLNSIKPANSITDNLMDKNLKDLSFSGNQKPTPLNSNYDLLTHSMTNTSLGNNQASRQSNLNSSFNSFSSPFSQMRPQSNQNLGFFGNLALPAPSSNSPQMNSVPNNSFNMHPNLATMNNSINSIPLIPGPPKFGSSMITKPNNQTVNNSQKSALDDLADIFG